MLDPTRLKRAYQTVRDDLLAERVAAGHWVGELSSSALSTATAISALSLADDRNLIRRGLDWLAAHQNADGGWGDTDRSLSNIATTILVRAAFALAGEAPLHEAMLGRAADYVARQGGIDGLRRRYGKDKTFAVPILTNAALAGLESWDDVAPLPFELACLPHALLGAIRLPVVSYAIPALVAIGQARFHHLPPRNPLVRWIRRLTAEPARRVLQRMQPASGGYLEATPLTSFVVMSLASIGLAGHAVCRRGVEFLRASVRADGSWPIDTNLATWGTTLAINALADDSHAAGESVRCLDWLLSCQHRAKHPFTSAAPGGWGWTDLSGAVPDADDTPGALLALAAISRSVDPNKHSQILDAARAGVRWLLDLQNRNGGWPTFCRGWGALPFDRSGVDLTAHAIRALAAWREQLPVEATRIERAIARGFEFLRTMQQPDGRWSPLWFGNQYQPDEDNPFYGTARTLLAYRDLGRIDAVEAVRARDWLAQQAGPEGGWGYGSFAAGGGVPGQASVEETAVSVEALLPWMHDGPTQSVVNKGLAWLVKSVETGGHRRASPIGLYFARLWYYERLYPLAFTAGALGRALDAAHLPRG